MSEVRWGILGAAKFAREFMGPALTLAPGGHVAALATSDPAKADAFRAFAPGLRVHDSFDALLADPAIDAVYIPLPNGLHVEWSLKAMQAGKHVLCEKPMAMQAGDFDRLIAARDAAGVVAAEAFMIVHHPQWQRARQLLADGAVGKLWRIDGAFSFNNRDPGNIRNRADMGGGCLRDIGVYVLGGARFATGLEGTDVRARIQWEDGVDVYAAISAKFGDADYVNFTSIRMHPRQEITFHGDEGVLRLPVPFNARVFGEARLELHRGTSTNTERWPAVNHYELQAAAFNRAVLDGAAYPCPLEFSRGTQAMMDAAFASAG
ncbi:Gfo/Idh/MocA family protein [Scleromatobacter humisilvae]|uniref:Gfo/Idh/MocA family oxidoreductase n=1 Tax=Scleromatobacter humisilvae TaxID=2897159 RepID=A0A9X1YSN4_9BURK|nr:Gfo/Idh/MocA family oxidoreductase [Scleromatobacter humisilvae]MCK9688581.1 Gfo/Idh/MocA family oxidoreductase [Scleromatobacter humisilvae]